VFYPSKVEVKQCTQFKPVPYVSTSEAEKVRTIVLSLTANLAAASDRLAVDLHVTSDPHTARFEIVAGESEPRHTTTDSDITNLYRGYYHYKIEKANYKTVKGPLNLIDEEGNSIHCILHEVNNAEGPYPCIIKNK
jgi:hypothetical protein